MKDFFVPKDLLLFSNDMEMNSDFSVRGFSAGASEAMGTLTVTVGAADAVLWTPTEITTAMWLDASAADTITMSGNYIESMLDMSGNDRTVNSSALSLLHTDNSIVFNNAASLSHALALSGFSTAGFDLFVLKPTQTLKTCADANSGTCLISDAPGCVIYAGGPSGQVGVAVGINGVQVYHHRTNVICAPLNYYTTISGYCIVLIVYSSSKPSLYLNGSFRKDGVVMTLSARQLTFGVGPYGKFAGNLCEHLCGTFVPDAALIDKLFGYAAHKWDAILGTTTLVGDLPTDHPYKSAAPTV